MARPWPHPKTGVFWFRKRIPKDLVSPVGKRGEKANLGTKDVGEAKRLHAAHAALVEARWANLRAGVRSLTLLEVHAIAGEFYDELIPKFQKGQFSPVFNLLATGVIERFIAVTGSKQRTEFLRFYGPEIDAHLARKGLLVHPETRGALESAIARRSFRPSSRA